MAVGLTTDEAPDESPAVDADVLIVGAGPTGMMLAAELALAGVDVLVVERRTDQAHPGTRARGVHARTLEVFDQRGIVDRFLAEGETAQTHAFGSTVLDASDLPTRHPYGLALVQPRIEAILAGWADDLAVRFERGRRVTGVAQDDEGVDALLDDGTALRGRYLVGCDGGRSAVRRAVGIAFPGTQATTTYLIAEAEMPDDPALGFRHDAAGRHAIGPRGGAPEVSVVVQETPPQLGDEPTFAELREAVIRVWGSDFGLRDATWISRFGDAARQAASYREGRVLLAGDAAHVHSPVGGQGLGTGVQDAVNLGWKLAQVVRGASPESLLDTYHDERHPVGARVLRGTLAATALMAGGDGSAALRETLAPILAMDGPRRALAGRFSGLDIHYDLGGGHPLVGRRVPDLDLVTPDGPLRLFELLHAAWPLLIAFDDDAEFDPSWEARVRFVRARYDGPWDLPVLGVVDAPAAVLVRPDGHVAWTGRLGGDDLPRAIATWFGAPTPPPG